MIIRRSAEAFIEPSGKASCAATSKRNGVVGVTAAGMLTPVIGAVQDFFAGAGNHPGHRR